MERLREGEACETTAASSEQEALRPTLPIAPPLMNELMESLGAYTAACSAVKAALLKHREDPELYGHARRVKDGQYDACRGVFERVLAHIGVRAP